MATVNPSASLPQNQPTCLNDVATGLIDCGNWAVSASWAVPSDAVSGIYFAKVVRPDTGGASHIVFVVRDDDGGSDILFQTSDTTWQAYNDYGGNSLYVGQPAGRAYAVSYNRPFVTRDVYPEDWVFNAEYPMVRWLEMNGYDVSYSTGVDSDRLGNELLEHQLFLSVGHDEYWSAAQRTNVEAARDAGLNLAFFSGNEIFWKTRWEASIDGSGTPYRTLVSYKETHDGAKIDPLPNVWTGTWRDPRFSPPADGGNPENGLTGTWFKVNIGTYAIQVPAEDGALRFWRHTSIASLSPGQVATLGEATLGYEWDEVPDNGFQPAGLMTLSTTKVTDATVLVDQGSTYEVGPATHYLTLYRASSGALIFSAGTVQWSWGLDGNHDRQFSTPDNRMQQATVNLFADMGVQPATLQSNLIPVTQTTDVTPPTSAILNPVDGSTVAQIGAVTVRGTAADTDGVVAGIEVSLDGGQRWHPATGRSSWQYDWTPTITGTVAIQSRAVDDSGNLSVPTTITVTVSDEPGLSNCPCTIWGPEAAPLNAAEPDPNAVELGVKFRAEIDGYITALRFYKGPGNDGPHIANLWTRNGQLIATAPFTAETALGWQQVDFAAPVAILRDTTYIASYYTASGYYAQDVAFFGESVARSPLLALAEGVDGSNGVFGYGASRFPSETFNASNYWVDVVFLPRETPDSTAPQLLTVTPMAEAAAVALDTPVTVQFNEPLDATSINELTFTLADTTGQPVTATVTFSYDARQATLLPTQPLAFGTTYVATVHGGSVNPVVRDGSGNALADDFVWSFTTPPPPPIPPNDGPGGPILVITTAGNPFSRYYNEILRAEGLNLFLSMDISRVDATVLQEYEVVILGEMALTGPQLQLLTDWVNAGGQLIAMRPDRRLAALLGLADSGSVLDRRLLAGGYKPATGAGNCRPDDAVPWPGGSVQLGGCDHFGDLVQQCQQFGRGAGGHPAHSRE